jgi:hypothetical protein|tara:strand:+ start:201 stop:377 length:177 start_codon:yes stop_codon:yes gene_type:complete
MTSDIHDNGSIWLKKRIILKYVDDEQIELFLEVLKAIAEENGIKVENGDIDYMLGADY